MIFRDVYFDGVRVKQGKSQMYADVFLRAKLPNGQVDVEQIKLRCFEEETIKVLRTLSAGEIINIDLQIKDAFLVGVQDPYSQAVEL